MVPVDIGLRPKGLPEGPCAEALLQEGPEVQKTFGYDTGAHTVATQEPDGST